MTDTNGQLTERQKDALNFTFADHLIALGERDDALKEVAELKLELAEKNVTIETLKKWGEQNDERLAKALDVRDRSVDRCAKYESFLDIIETAIPKLRAQKDEVP